MSDTFACYLCGHTEEEKFSVCPTCFAPQGSKKATPKKVKIPVSTATKEAVAVPVPGQPVRDGVGCVIGIDPGARYTGIAVIDGNEELLASWVFVRPEDMDDLLVWSKTLRDMIDTEVLPLFPGASIGVEKVSEPKGFHRGAQAAMNPKDIMWTALLVGAMAVHYDGAVFIRPGNNGGQDAEFYPEALFGRRPPTLIGTHNKAPRKHERSAFDVAKKALLLLDDA